VEDDVLGEVRLSGPQFAYLVSHLEPNSWTGRQSSDASTGAYKRVMECLGTEHNNQVVNDPPIGEQGS
jgi:hypothetical protein